MIVVEMGTITDFLQSLSLISGYCFQIFDLKGKTLFSTRNEDLSECSLAPVTETLHKVIESDSFYYDAQYTIGGVPLYNSKGNWGVLLVNHFSPETSNPEAPEDITSRVEMKNLEAFLYHTATILEENMTYREEISEMAEELDQSFADLNLYSRIATQIKRLLFSDDMLNNLLRDLLNDMRSDIAFSNFFDPERENFKIMSQETEKKLSNPDELIKALYLSIDPASISVKDNYFIINDSRQKAAFKALYPEPFRFLAVKIQYNERFYGWLGLVSFNMKEIFRRGELRLLISMAEQLAIVIANSELYQDLEKFIINMVKTLVIAIEAKDIYTRGHSERVARYSEMIGKRFNLSEEEEKELRWASILHDIGKIGIPEDILNKNGSLNDEEYATIKQHPVKGGVILKPVEQLTGSLGGIIHHHERFDGKGYPDGLKGDEIPLCARIIAVADTFDAINSTRSYRSARGKKETLDIILKVSGTQLDPEVVNVFKKVCEEELILEDETTNESPEQ